MMAARFTEHAGDPQWLRDQRDAARRATKLGTMPAGRTAPTPTVVTPSTQQFVQGAKSNGAAAFVLGALVGAAVARGRR